MDWASATMTHVEFCDWLVKMEISHVKAAWLLHVDRIIIDGYSAGSLVVATRHVWQCRRLLELSLETEAKKKNADDLSVIVA